MNGLLVAADLTVLSSAMLTAEKPWAQPLPTPDAPDGLGPGTPQTRGPMGSTIKAHFCPGYGDTPCPDLVICLRSKRCRACTHGQRKLDLKRWALERALRDKAKAAADKEAKRDIGSLEPERATPAQLTQEIDRVIKYTL
jgi:hypothetical protein